MDFCIEILDAVIADAERLKKILKKNRSLVIERRTERDLIKATSYVWVKEHMSSLIGVFGRNPEIDKINDFYVKILSASERRTKRSIYFGLLDGLKKTLIETRTNIISGALVANPAVGASKVPNFSALISNSIMINILERRWIEVGNCIKGGAPLAGIIMMGSLLEALFLAKINKLDDKSILFKLKSTPQDVATKKAKPLSEWMLKDFIDTLCEAKIIRDMSASFSRNIRDYRNFVHPEKELRTGIIINDDDVRLCWPVIQEIVRQLLTVNK